MRRLLLATAAALLAGPALAADPPDPFAARVARILKATPLIDGHNDWPESLRDREKPEELWTIDLQRDLDRRAKPYNTDIARLRKGLVGGQFWSVFVPASLPPLEQVERTIEQIDLVKQIVARYPQVFELATTAADVRRIHAAGRIASLMGVEGGGQIDANLAVLRAYKALGAGYLTLTHFKTIDWADSATDAPLHHGLTPFGRAVVRELNRVGMLVDLSHTSADTMRDAIAASRAPVIFSHSGARAIDDHPRNVPDDVLRLLRAKDGVVMVNFYDTYVSEEVRRWVADNAAERARLASLNTGASDKAAAALKDWESAHPRPHATLSEVADHIAHIAQVAGVDHVGLGSDFDGVGNELPTGLEGVDRYPALLAELMRRGWSDQDIAKLAGNNILRVMEAAERTSAGMRGESPGNAIEAVLDKIK